MKPSNPKPTSSEALSGSTGLFGTCSVLCLVAAGAIWACGLHASSVMQLSHSKYFDQFLVLLQQLLQSLDMTMLIPVIYDISAELHYGAAMSGLVLAARYALQPLALFVGRMVCNLPYEHQRQIVDAASWVNVLLTWSCVAVLAMSQHWQDATVMSLLVTLRALNGFAFAIFTTPLEAMAFEQASMDNRATLSLLCFLLLGLGLFLGPVLCSTLLEIYKTNMASRSGQDVLSFLGTMWSIYTLLQTMRPPSVPEGDARLLSPEEVEVTDDARWEGVSEEKRKSLVWVVVRFTAERSFTSSAMEVATSLMLETKYGWKAQAIGFVMGAIFLGTAVMGCLVLLVRGWLVSDRQLMMILAVSGMLGSLGFVDWAGVGGPRSAWLLILADIVNYTSMIQLSGFMDGVAMQAAVPNSSCSLQNLAGS